MTVLVTGASGFTGFNLCRRLVRDSQPVRAIVRASSRTAGLATIGIDCRVADLAEPATLAPAFEGVSVVYHIAAAYRTEHADTDEFRRVNVDGTRHLLELALRHGVSRFVHCSTVGVQGQIDDPPATEEYRLQPGDHYQDSKLEGERVALEYGLKGLPVAVFRPVGIYGPGDHRFLKLFRAVHRRRFVMIGSGDTLYHLTYIDDLIDGILLVGQRPEALGEVITLAGARYTTIRTLVNLIADVLRVPHPRRRVPVGPVLAASVVCERVFRAIGATPPLYPRRVEFFSKDRAFDIGKARRLLGYQPKVALEDGLRRTAEWYREEGLL